MTHDRVRWGIAGLLAFEAIIAAYTLAGAPLFSAMYFVGVVALALAWWRGPQRWHFAALALASLVRAYLQTAGGAALGIYPTYLVPLGFAWLALAPRAMPGAALSAVALARTWFVLWYLLQGNGLVAAANVLGAAGAWLWASAQISPEAGGEDAASAPAPPQG